MADDISSLITDRTERLFWAKVDKRGPDDCWPWKGPLNRGGYGQVMLRDHKPRRAHHLALHFDGRPRPGDLHTLHSCDNRKCVNPAHLRWGTVAENAQEKVARGRAHDTSGERNAHHKLTEDQVRAIRESSKTQRALAAEYQVTHTVIGRIKRRQKWKCVE
jgi:hypothetical protein